MTVTGIAKLTHDFFEAEVAVSTVSAAVISMNIRLNRKNTSESIVCAVLRILKGVWSKILRCFVYRDEDIELQKNGNSD